MRIREGLHRLGNGTINVYLVAAAANERVRAGGAATAG
jgi:hypothetical protein